MESFIQDLRLSVRSLLKTRGFTVASVLALALGIGATTAMFSVLYGVLLRPLPYPESAQIVEPAWNYQGQQSGMNATWRQFQFIEEHSRVFQYLAATTPVGFSVFTGSEAVRASALRVSRDYFHVLGVTPALGRGFLAQEDQPGGAHVVVLSHEFWRQRYAGNVGILGQSILLDGEPYTVVGIMPAGFQAMPAVDLWSTMGLVSATIGGGSNLEVIGRLPPGLSLARARAGLQAMNAAFAEEFKSEMPKGMRLELMQYQSLVSMDVRSPVLVLFGAIGFVLLIACANVANLLFGRAAARGRELSLRVALGASRGRIVRQLVTESVLLALAGGILGLLLAYWGLHALLTLAPDALPRTTAIHLDRWAMLFAFGISLLTGVLSGFLPAWRAARADVQDVLKESSRSATGSARQGRARNVLVVGEIALSLVLLVGAGLLIRTYANLARTDAGFDAGHLLTAEIWLPGERYDSTAKVTNFYQDVMDRLAAQPGVRSATVVEAGLPLERGGNVNPQIEGQAGRPSVDYRTVTPGFFQTLGVKLDQGRAIASTDAAGSEPVVNVNEAFVRRYLAGRDAVGSVLTLSGSPRRIVGVVGDVKSFIGNPAPAIIYLPSAQTPIGLTRAFGVWFPTHVIVRTAGDPATLQNSLVRTIRTVDPQVPIGRVRSMDDVLHASLQIQRFVMTLLSIFAALALVLASVGVYGLMSYVVAQRTHEIGVRMAIGARSADVMRLVIGRAMLLAVIGVVLGLVGARLLTHLLSSQLFGVQATDLVTFAGVSGVLVLVALAASYLPARRATRVDPMIALRSE
jgi:predicted permease